MKTWHDRVLKSRSFDRLLNLYGDILLKFKDQNYIKMELKRRFKIQQRPLKHPCIKDSSRGFF